MWRQEAARGAAAAPAAACGQRRRRRRTPAPRPPAPPRPSVEPTTVPPEPVRDDAIASASLDELNRNSPLRPVFFALDSSEIDAAAKAVLEANAPLHEAVSGLGR